MVCFSNQFRFYNKYQGILRKMHFKRLWSIMYFNYHTNWKEVYVANSSPLFETLNAVYSSALNTWWQLESQSGCLSDWAIIKLDNYQQISYYSYFYTILHEIKIQRHVDMTPSPPVVLYSIGICTYAGQLKIQWNLSITTIWWDTSLPSGAHLGGHGPPRWAPEDRNC